MPVQSGSERQIALLVFTWVTKQVITHLKVLNISCLRGRVKFGVHLLRMPLGFHHNEKFSSGNLHRSLLKLNFILC